MHNPIEALREKMQTRGMDAWIVKMADPHLSEYIPEHWMAIRRLVGFTGSAGTVIVTQKEVALFVDSRYWVQAQNQTPADVVEVVRSGAPDAPDFYEWLYNHLPDEARVGICPSYLSINRFREFQMALCEMDFECVTSDDLIDEIWVEDRPVCPNSTIDALDGDAALVRERLAAVRKPMQELGIDAHLVGALDDIAWLTGCRGSDIQYNPVFLAYLLITPADCLLFADESRFTARARTMLDEAGVKICPPDSLDAALAAIGEAGVWADPDRLNAAWLTNQLNIVHEDISPITINKSRKSPQELESIRRVMVKDGVALSEFFARLDEAVSRGCPMTEMDAAAMLDEQRLAQPDCFGLSFGTISAFGENAALPHYSATAEHNRTFDNGLYLVDSGGQYTGGTTDITRVVPVGSISEQERRDVTLVLKSHIALAMAKVPQGSSGAQLDALARAPLWREGMDFGHGTGHGVGFVLNVHEGPFHISPRASGSGELGVQPGIVVSDEPGLYREGSHGVRIENLLAAVASQKTAFGDFIEFEVLTLCPIDLRCVDLQALTAVERDWVRGYHEKVQAALLPHLSERAATWLKKVTRMDS